MFISNNRALFHLWWKENLVKQQLQVFSGCELFSTFLLVLLPRFFCVAPFKLFFLHVSSIMSTRLNLADLFPQHSLWTFLNDLASLLDIFTRTDLSRTTDWLIGSIAGNSLLSLGQGSRSVLLPEWISPSFDYKEGCHLVSCWKNSSTSPRLTWAAINSWANSFLSLFNSFFDFTIVLRRDWFPDKNSDSLVFVNWCIYILWFGYLSFLHELVSLFFTTSLNFLDGLHNIRPHNISRVQLN